MECVRTVCLRICAISLLSYNLNVKKQTSPLIKMFWQSLSVKMFLSSLKHSKALLKQRFMQQRMPMNANLSMFQAGERLHSKDPWIRI